LSITGLTMTTDLPPTPRALTLVCRKNMSCFPQLSPSHSVECNCIAAEQSKTPNFSRSLRVSSPERSPKWRRESRETVSARYSEHVDGVAGSHTRCHHPFSLRRIPTQLEPAPLARSISEHRFAIRRRELGSGGGSETLRALLEGMSNATFLDLEVLWTVLGSR